MKQMFRIAARTACMVAVSAAFATAAQAQQVMMKSAQQARTSANNVLQINNPTSGSTCVNGMAKWSAGDMLVAVVNIDTNGAAVPVTASGFTQLGTTRVANGVQQTVLYRPLSSAPSSVTFTWGPMKPAIAFLYAFKGANSIDPIDDAGGSLADQGAVMAAPGTTASAAGAIHAMVLAQSGPSGSTVGAASPTYASGCNATAGRFGRLIGSSTADPTGTDYLSAGMFAQPVPVGPVSGYTATSTGTSNIGTAFILKP